MYVSNSTHMAIIEELPSALPKLTGRAYQDGEQVAESA